MVSTQVHKNPQDYDVAVVGAGVGGLAAAALLARWGFKVVLLEQHNLAGGFCTSWDRVLNRGGERLRFVFDSGVHDISGAGPGGTINGLLQELGVSEQVTWVAVSQEYHAGNIRLRMPRGEAAVLQKLCSLFSQEASALQLFFAQMRWMHDNYHRLMRDGNAESSKASLDKWSQAQPAKNAALHLDQDLWHTGYTKLLHRHFRDPTLIELLAMPAIFLSPEPNRLTLLHMAPAMGYLLQGGHYPRGGSQAYADALVAGIVHHGGTVRLRTAVTSITWHDGRVAGVAIEGSDGKQRQLRTGAVISNADAIQTGRRLLAGPGSAGLEQHPGAAAFQTQLARLKPSGSAYMVFVGLDAVPDIAGVTMANLGMMAPCVSDQSLAPPGHAALTLIKRVPPEEAATWDRNAAHYKERKRAVGESILAAAETTMPGLGKHVLFAQVATPQTHQRYAWTYTGGIYGPSSQHPRLNARTPVPGLFMAGAAAMPGPGVEAASFSGRLAAEAAAAYLGGRA